MSRGTAMLEVRVFPWRPRARVMSPRVLREVADPSDALDLADDLVGLVLGLALWLVVVVAAPLAVLVLAALLLSVELPVVLAAAVVLLVARFAGVLPWTVLILDPVTGAQRRESYRWIGAAVTRVRAVNGGGPVRVRWAWA